MESVECRANKLLRRRPRLLPNRLLLVVHRRRNLSLIFFFLIESGLSTEIANAVKDADRHTRGSQGRRSVLCRVPDG